MVKGSPIPRSRTETPASVRAESIETDEASEKRITAKASSVSVFTDSDPTDPVKRSNPPGPTISPATMSTNGPVIDSRSNSPATMA